MSNVLYRLITLIRVMCSITDLDPYSGVSCGNGAAHPLWSFANAEGNDCDVEWPRNPGGHSRGRSRDGDVRRARAAAWGGWKHLQGPGIQSTAWHAMRVH